MGKFINPSTDWGFKHIFGKKEFLIDFLNDLLEGERVITDIRYMNNERTPEHLEMRKVIYDIFCETDTGEHIIVEMQNRWQEHFRDRALFYMSKSIAQQGITGSEWDFNLTAVYGVFFINFMLDKELDGHFCKDIALIDKRTGKVFNNKFRQIYIELPKFKKEENQCENSLEYWIYNLVNMHKMEEISFKDKKAIFDRLEKVAAQANLSKDERAKYEEEWKIYNDYFNTIESAKKKAAEEAMEIGMQKGIEKGMEKGIEKGMQKGIEKGMQKGMEKGMQKGMQKGMEAGIASTAKNLKALGMKPEIIQQATGLSLEEIEKL